MENTTQKQMAETITKNHPFLAARVAQQLAAGQVLPCDCDKCRMAKLPRKAVR